MNKTAGQAGQSTSKAAGNASESMNKTAGEPWSSLRTQQSLQGSGYKRVLLV